MYFEAVQQYIKSLNNLDSILTKATQDAEARKFDVNNYLTARLAPDMFALGKQIQIACDMAKAGASSFAGKEAPKHEDVEKTLPELQERIRKCVAYLKTFQKSDFADTSDEQKIKLTHPPGKFMRAQDALLSRSMPNFYFHIVTAYALLRQGGTPIGKKDYLGELNILDA